MPILAVGLIAASLILVALTVLDLGRKVPLINPVMMAILLPVILNAPLVGWLAYQSLELPWRWILVVVGVLLLYVWIHLNVFPIMDGVRVGLRLKALGGATPILYALCYATLAQAVVLPLSFIGGSELPIDLLIINAIFSIVCCLTLYLNGALRAILLSKSLSVATRIFLALTLWVPLIGWIAGVGVGRTVRREYLAAVDRVEWEQTIPLDGQCATRYPLLLVHGVGWRDRELFNAWGRIPKYLKRHGAAVFHGEQEAWGTVASNGEHLAARIRNVLDQTGAHRVNILAHSRGGIDARYAISTLGMGDQVASLTTIGTPHHGVRFTDTATKLKEPIYRRLAAAVDAIFRLAGDTTPDFFSSTMSFRTGEAREFNRENPDDPAVFYQSYSSVMSRASSDRVLAVPYRIIKALGEENDGLVSVQSAQWGDVRGVLRSTTRRGVSHGDLVDLHREDYDGFNVLEAYIGIVADLKDRGY